MTGPAPTGPAPTGAVLAPLRDRYAAWLRMDDARLRAEAAEVEDDLWAMQMVLRMERAQPPSWHAAVALAARCAAALCLDGRGEPGGPWYPALAQYCAGRIRKVTRRARASHWDAVGELPGITLADGPTQVRALLPGPVSAVDARVSRLQVGGTDAPVDGPLPPNPPGAPVLRLWIPREPAMTLGKTMAQSGHAGMIAAAMLAGHDRPALGRFIQAGMPIEVVRADREWPELLAELRDPAAAWETRRLVGVRDAGYTEIDPGTITAIGQGPT